MPHAKAGDRCDHDDDRRRFHARIVKGLVTDGHSAIVPEVTGMAYRTGEHRFEIDAADELGTGFVLR